MRRTRSQVCNGLSICGDAFEGIPGLFQRVEVAGYRRLRDSRLGRNLVDDNDPVSKRGAVLSILLARDAHIGAHGGYVAHALPELAGLRCVERSTLLPVNVITPAEDCHKPAAGLQSPQSLHQVAE